jgi:lipoprotein signal peptidase
MTNVELQIQKHHSAWIYLLPSLHLCASAGIAFSKLTAGLLYLSYIDFPLSAILLWMTFRTGHPNDLFRNLGNTLVVSTEFGRSVVYQPVHS